MDHAKNRLFLAASVVLFLGSACSSIRAAPLTTAASEASTATTVEIDGGACRLGAIRACPVTTTLPPLEPTTVPEVDGGACRLRAISVCPVPAP